MSVLRKAGKMLQHDLSVGLWQCVRFYPAIIVYILSVCVLYDQRFFRWAELQTVPVRSPAVGDYLSYLFQGMEPYQFSLQNGFRLPAVWVMAFLLFVLSIAKYPQGDLYGVGQQLLLKSGSRMAWWGSKIAWTAICAVAYYMVCFLTIFTYLTFMHGIKWQPSDFATSVLPGLATLSLAESFLWLVAAPILTLCALGAMELFIGVLAAPVVGVIIVVATLLAALYFNLTFLPGGTCILLRSALTGQDGVTLQGALGVPWIAFLICASVGCFLFQKLNLYRNREV